MANNFFKIDKGLTLNPQTSVTSPANGDIYYDSTRATYVFRNNGNLVDLQKKTDVTSTSSMTSADFAAPVVQSSIIRITGSTAGNIHGFAASSDAKVFFLYNISTQIMTVKNQSATEGTASNRIVTATGTDVAIEPGQALQIGYDAGQSRWVVLSSPSTDNSGVSDLSTLFQQDFENAVLGDFTQTGLILDTTTADVINGLVTAKLIHQNAVNQNFKQIIALPNKYRYPQNLTIKIWARSSATAGNVVLNIRDETNNAAILSNQSVSTVTTAGGNENLWSFDVPNTCTSISYEIVALPEAGSPNTFIDDISISLTESELTQSLLIQDQDAVFSIQAFTGMTLASTNTGVFYFPTYSVRQNIGSAYTINQSATLGTSITILKEGIHRFTFGYNPNTTQRIAYITRNATVLTATTVTNPAEIVQAKFTNSPTNTDDWSITGECYCYVGDVIRFQLNGASNIENTGSAADNLTCSWQGDLKQINTNPDSKVTIPTSEVRFVGASTRGATATAIVRFDSVAKITGSAFTVVSDANNGTAVTMTKAGYVSVSANLSVTNQTTYLTLNQAVLTANPSSISAEVLATAYYNVAANGQYTFHWSGFVKVGDVIRVSCGTNPSASFANNLHITHQEQDIALSVTNLQPKWSEADSYVRLDTSNGFGSSGTAIRRFSNIRQNVGTDIAYVDDATNGASFTILVDGIYQIAYTDSFASNSSAAHGISLNASSLTTGVQNLATTERLAFHSTGTATGTINTTVSWQGFLAAGSVIRPHTAATAVGTAAQANFTISKVGKPNIAQVDVTPFVDIPQPIYQTFEALTSNAFASTNTGVANLNVTKSLGSGIFSAVSSATLGTTFTVLKRCRMNISAAFSYAANGIAGQITRNSAGLTTGTATGILTIMQGSNGDVPTIATEIIAEVGDVIRIQRNNANVTDVPYATVTAEALSSQVLTDVESFSTDTTPLVYAGSATYTLATLANAAPGTFITFTVAAGGNTRTQTNAAAPTQTVGDMATNGIRIFTRAFGATSTAASPALIAIQIGKGYKGVSVNLYKSTGKTTSGAFDLYLNGSAEYGLRYREYNEATGILLLDAATCEGGGITTKQILFSDVTAGTDGYITINASKNPSLIGITAPTKVWTSYRMTAATGVNTDLAANFRLADNCGAWNGSLFTAPYAGTYRLSVNASVSVAAGGTWVLTAFKNGTSFQGMAQWANGPAGGSNQPCSATIVLDLSKGETLSARFTSIASGMVTIATSDFGSISIESLEIK